MQSNIKKKRDLWVARARQLNQEELEVLKQDYKMEYEKLALKFEKAICDELNFGLGSYINKEPTVLAEFKRKFVEETAAVIERQFEWKESTLGESNYGLEKLIKLKVDQKTKSNFSEKNTYLYKYMMEAVKTFCRKKRNFYAKEREKRKERIEKEKHNGYKHNPGLACRELFHGIGCEDEWLSKNAIKVIESASFNDETIEEVNQYFRKKKVSQDKIQCFWDRIEGMSFADMARIYDGTITKQSTYTKKFKRFSVSPIINCEEFRKLLLNQYS